MCPSTDAYIHVFIHTYGRMLPVLRSKEMRKHATIGINPKDDLKKAGAREGTLGQYVSQIHRDRGKSIAARQGQSLGLRP